MLKHTSGDWVQSDTDPTWIMAGRIHVATIPRAHDGDWSRANARLITAAPKLLGLVDRFALIAECMPDPLVGDWNWPELAKEAREVIAKATAE
jgi:hypothetical protein